MRFGLMMVFLLTAAQAQAQMLGAPLVSTSVGGIVSGTNVYGQNISGTVGTFGSIGSGLINVTGISVTTNQTSVTTLYASGNVGIGTTSPNYNLRVVNTTGPGSYTARFDSNSGNTVTYMAADTIGLYVSSSVSGVYAVYGRVTGGDTAIGVTGVSDNTGSSGGAFNNTASTYYCYLGTGSYSIQCSGPTSGLSDGRLKKDIVALDSKEGLAAIMRLRPVTYRWKDERKNHQGDPHYRELGFIAQDVEKVLPDLVGETVQPSATADPLVKGKVKSLEYERLAVPIVKAIQELKADNDNLRAEFEAYKRAHP